MEHFYQTIPGYFTYPDFYAWLARLVASVDAKKPNLIVELGTNCGQSAAFLGVELINRKATCEIDCIDFFHDGIDKVKAALKPVQSVIGLILPSDTSTASTRYRDRSIDAVFIDADHSYEGVARDIDAWLPKVRAGGIIAGHDFCNEFPGIIRAVTERFKTFTIRRGEKWANGKMSLDGSVGEYYPTWCVQL